jgi:hypothetical protein
MYAAERGCTGAFEISRFHGLFAGKIGHPPRTGTSGDDIPSVAPGAIEVHISEPGVNVISSDLRRKVVGIWSAAVGESEMGVTVKRQAKIKTAPAAKAPIDKQRFVEIAAPCTSGVCRHEFFLILSDPFHPL